MAKLLLNKQINFSNGRLEVMGVRDCFTPAITFIEIQKELMKSGSQYLIYNSAKQSGYNWFKHMSKVYKGMKKTEAINWALNLISLSGWGIATLEKLDTETKSSVFVMKNSTVAKGFGKCNLLVDHLFRGLAAGGGSYILNDDLDCIETHCISKGDPVCRFLVGKLESLSVSKTDLLTDFGKGIL